MKIRNEDVWEGTVAANPLPDGFSTDPTEWPAELTDEQAGACYGATVVIAAGRWMDAMEELLADGDHPAWTVADIADACFRDVDAGLGRFGLTGFQYGVAVHILADVWEYGEELRRWHNLATQIHDEGERANETGGVLNPALLTFERPT
jgi:hypothetical protein